MDTRDPNGSNSTSVLLIIGYATKRISLTERRIEECMTLGTYAITGSHMIQNQESFAGEDILK
jgi:hypothetical protein